MAVMVSNKIWMEKYRSHYTENPLSLAVIKDSFKIYFHEIEKTSSGRRDIWGIETKRFPLARKLVSTN